MCYAGYYIRGFEEVFGRKAVKYSLGPFRDLDRRNERASYDQYMAAVLITDRQKINIIIDYWDLNGISHQAYNWCDVYAKINISHEQDLVAYDKLLSIPPGFGIKTKNTFGLVCLGLLNFLRCRCQPITSLKGHIFDYYAQNRYAPLEVYLSEGVERPSYVFHASTLWPHVNCVNYTNPLRLSFMKACKSNAGITFEGGFFIKYDAPREYQDFALEKYIPKREYMQKILESAIVFNTPAVHNCHGWKLGEYLAMGKAIISTPISNRLPSVLLNGEHLYIVNTPEDMKDAVNILLTNEKMRQTLKRNCKKYYEEYASPSAIIRNIIHFYHQRHETKSTLS